MPKRKVKRESHSKKGTWAGFTPTQVIVIFSVFIIFAVFYMM